MNPMSSKGALAAWKKDPTRLLAVDIGNTALKFGLFDLPHLSIAALSIRRNSPAPFFYPFSLVDLRILKTQLKVIPVWLETFAHNAPDRKEPFFWNISSVNPKRTEEFSEFLRRKRPDDLVALIDGADVPIPTAYDHPDRLGVDRKLAALAASRFFDRPGPVLVVDIGTAAKIDLIDESGTFLGGVILPGPETQLCSLNEKTDRLPELDWSIRKARTDYPATETAGGIRLGVMGGLLGAILFFYRKTLEKTGRDFVPLLLTGGGGIGVEPILEPLLAQHFPTASPFPRHVYTVRDLVLSGIALASAENGFIGEFASNNALFP